MRFDVAFTRFHPFIYSKFLLVSLPEQQLARLIARNPQLTRKAARQRIDSQMPVEQKRARATHAIYNSDSMDATKRQVEDVFREVMPSFFRTLAWWMLLAGPAAFGYSTLVAWDVADAIWTQAKLAIFGAGRVVVDMGADASAALPEEARNLRRRN